MSKLSKEFYKEFKPKNTVLIWDKKLFTTDVLIVRGREYLVWYINSWWKLEPRLFYRSASEAEWRSTPGRRSDGALSKAEVLKNASYETTTKVDPKIWEIFDWFDQKGWKASPVRLSDELSWAEMNAEAMWNEITIKRMFPDHPINAVDFYNWYKVSDVMNRYKNLKTPWLNIFDMKLDSSKWYSFKHDYLWDVNVDVMKTTWNKLPVDIHFARSADDPSKVRIANVLQSDAKINSFWVYDKQLNAGALVAKPIDYTQQLPWLYSWKEYGNNYEDIRDLYQEMPIIKSYKKLRLKSS